MDTYEDINQQDAPETPEIFEQPEQPPIPEQTECCETFGAPEEPEVPEVPEEPEVPAAPKPAKKSGKGLLAVLLAVAMTITGCGITAWLVNAYWAENQSKTLYAIQMLNNRIEQLQQEIQDNSFTGNGNSVSGTPNTTPDGSLTPGQVYAQNVKAVVAVSNQATTNIYGETTQTASSGSGFIISEDGYVVTNYHVVEGATKLTVILHDGQEYVARLIGYDAGNDMAVLKIDASGLHCVKLGSSKDLIVGDQVVAIGNPLGQLTNSLTVGYVSALERGIYSGGAKINMIQTDVAINSGNSGGPLFNMKGEVVGITTAKYSGTSNSGATIEGISFAVPFDDVRKKITDLKDYGYLRGAYLGITVSDDSAGRGALVKEVTPGNCAAKGGMRAGDIILSLGGYPVTCMNDLGRALEHFSAGETVQVEVLRNSKTLLLELLLDERPQVTNTDATEPTIAETQPTEANPVPQNGTMEDWWNFFFGN